MAKIGPDPLWTALRTAGLADDSTRRVVIDVLHGHLPIVHTERYGDDGLLNVVAIAGRVEILRGGPLPVPEKPAEPLTDPGAGSAKAEPAQTATAAQRDPDVCPRPGRVDGNGHSWKFDGDNPIIVCHYCHETRDAISGVVIP